MIETLSSVWRKTGGMSLNEDGVDAINVLCSSGVMNLGSVSTNEMGGILQRISSLILYKLGRVAAECSGK